MLKGTVEKIKELLFKKQAAYKEVFKPSLSVDYVLSDLAKFCHANDTAFNADARLHAVLEGRREVFLRITKNLNMSSEELWKLYGKGLE